MALTRNFIDTIKKRAETDFAFRRELLAEAAECFFSDDLQTGKLILRNYVNATIGFQKLSALTGKKDTSLMRMLSAEGNPTAENFFEIFAVLQKEEGIGLFVEAREPANKNSKSKPHKRKKAVLYA